MATKPKTTEYKQSSAVTNIQKQLAAQEKAKPADWNGGTYQEAVKDTIEKILNRDKFSYDLNGDALYQQYKDQYSVLGKQAMMDTMGQAAALTGGYGNSYASTAGNQAYQSYLQQLNDIVPDLYGMALNQYNQEGQDLINQYGVLSDQYNQEYGRYRDQVGDWQTQLKYLADRYANERNFDYSKYSDNRDFQWQRYDSDVANEWKQKEFEETVRQNNIANEWKQKEFEEAVRQFNETLKKNSSKTSSKLKNNPKPKGNPKPKKDASVEKYTSSEALKQATANGASLDQSLINLKAMLDEGNITQKQYDDLKMALNPQYSYK